MEELGTTMPCMLPSFIKYRTNIKLEIKTPATPQHLKLGRNMTE
jgi:hypothetical protein